MQTLDYVSNRVKQTVKFILRLECFHMFTLFDMTTEEQYTHVTKCYTLVIHAQITSKLNICYSLSVYKNY
jgi:hypothetical protein